MMGLSAASSHFIITETEPILNHAEECYGMDGTL
jgi:hypothetical protein